MSSRLNARVDDELARKVEALSRATGKSASSIIEAALEAYIESARVCHLLAARLSVDAELALRAKRECGRF
jgi:predicted transcriptional regulator